MSAALFCGCIDPRFGEFGVRKEGNTLLARQEIVPEFLDSIRAGKSAGHANYSYPFVLILNCAHLLNLPGLPGGILLAF